jgi:hypothetical protein
LRLHESGAVRLRLTCKCISEIKARLKVINNFEERLKLQQRGSSTPVNAPVGFGLAFKRMGDVVVHLKVN